MNRGHKVKPRSTAVIRDVAQNIKDMCQVDGSFFPIALFLELMHQQGLLELEILGESEMLHDFGLTYPQEKKIVIREDVYDRAVDNDGFGRFTLAHELGHFILHKEEFCYARNEHGGKHKVYEDSEWQADKFAQELLADMRHVTSSDTIEDLQKKFGISRKAAEVTYRALRGKKVNTPSSEHNKGYQMKYN